MQILNLTTLTITSKISPDPSDNFPNKFFHKSWLRIRIAILRIKFLASLSQAKFLWADLVDNILYKVVIISGAVHVFLRSLAELPFSEFFVGVGNYLEQLW